MTRRGRMEKYNRNHPVKVVEDGDEFDLGFLLATASVARAGVDTLAWELLGEAGVQSVSDLKKVKDLEPFDREPLERVIRLSK
jgi:hypothetical protein